MAFRHTPYHLLIEAFTKRGCPICGIVQDAILHYLDMLIHENVNDLQFREELRKAGGFCNAHGWWLAHRLRGGALGTAIMYRDVLHTLRLRLASIPPGGSVFASSSRRRARVPFSAEERPAADPHTHCPACLLQMREEKAFLGTLLAHLGEWHFIEAYQRSDGLCMVHVDAALAACRDSRAARQFVEAHDGILQRLIAELDEFQRKTDYRFQAEAAGAEADSWLRAIEMVNGKQGMR